MVSNSVAPQEVFVSIGEIPRMKALSRIMFAFVLLIQIASFSSCLNSCPRPLTLLSSMDFGSSYSVCRVLPMEVKLVLEGIGDNKLRVFVRLDTMPFIRT